MSAPRLSWTSIQSLLRCHLQYTLRFVDKVQVTEDASRFIEGRGLHAGLALWWNLSVREKTQGHLERCMLEGFDAEVAAERRKGLLHLRPKAQVRVCQAGENALAVIKRERLLGPEPSVEKTFVTGFEGFALTGRHDLFVETMDGELALVDYKYTENARYGNRLQLVTQAIGVKALYGEFPSVAAFLLCKGTTRHLRRIRFAKPEDEVGKFGERLVAAWSDYGHTPREPSFDVYKCDFCSVKGLCRVYQDTHPGAQRGDIVHGNRRQIEL